MSETTLLEGQISIEAVLNAESRPIKRIIARSDRTDRDLRRLLKRAEAAGIPTERAPLAQIDEQAQGSTHGGVIAYAGPRITLPLADLLPADGAAYIAMLDGIEDPFNFGYAIRALWAAGADGVVVRPRNWMSAAGTVARASAGASELIPTAVAETTLDAAAFFRQQGVTVACTGLSEGAVPLYEADLTVPLFILIGGERRGITRSFMSQADLVLSIPYGRTFDKSLGTTAAAGVLAFEVMRQRR
jgi:23S rRNA (guanosine2251-2'-O)-methyltransferase